MEQINVWQYWHGERTSAVLRLEKTVETLYSEKRGYKYHRLTDEDLPEEIKNLFQKGCRVENITDALRFWLIYHEGGIWFDSDMVTRTEINFHDILKSPEVGISANVKNRGTVWAAPCILGGNKGCFLFKKMLDSALDTMNKNGRNFGYADVGPKLATKILKYHKHKWFVLPWKGWRHQLDGNRLMEYRNFTDMYKYGDIVYGNDWSYAHFCGGNVRWWASMGMQCGNVMGDTVERVEKELGYTYEREV